MRLTKHICARHRLAGATVLAVLLLVVVSQISADPPGSPYEPGTELDPSCSPGSANCTVSFAADMVIGNPVTSGTSGSVLFVDSSGELGQDNSNLFFDDANDALRINTNAGSGAGEKLTVLTGEAQYGFVHTNGTVNVGSWAGTGFGVEGGWYGTQSNHPLYLFTNDGNPNVVIGTNGNMGVGGGTDSPAFRGEFSGGVDVDSGAAGSNFNYNVDGNFFGTQETAFANLFIGSGSGDSFGAGGFDNTFVGISAGQGNTTGTQNTFIGKEAGILNTTGEHNTIVGTYAFGSNTVGNYNAAFGDASLNANTGNNNTAIGNDSLFNNISGDDNSALGYFSLHGNTTGDSNTAFGRSTLLGNSTGSLNTAIGYQADVGVDGLTNATAIGANAIVGASDSLVLGGTGIYAVKVGIGTTTPVSRLTVTGGDVYVETQGNGIMLRDTDAATCHLITVNAAGTLSAGSAIACP